MFGLLTLSRYYYLILVIVPLTEPERRVRLLFAVNTALLAWTLVDREAAYQWGHFLWLAYFGSYWVDRVNLSRLARCLTNPTKPLSIRG